MKKFERHRTYDEIKQACKDQRLNLDDWHYLHAGWDTIVVEGGGCKVYYNTFNGKFFGSVAGIEFDSGEAKHEHLAWFQGLLSFFYVEKA